jgi:hypothetical protein
MEKTEHSEKRVIIGRPKHETRGGVHFTTDTRTHDKIHIMSVFWEAGGQGVRNLKTKISELWLDAEMNIGSHESQMRRCYHPVKRFVIKVSIAASMAIAQHRYERCERNGHQWVVTGVNMDEGVEVMICKRCGADSDVYNR